MSEQVEKICVQRFLDWYNEQHKINYIYERAEHRFTKLKSRLRWEFVAYEPDNPEKWIGIEVKELITVREVHIQFEFWRKLCLELTQDLEAKGIPGEFGILPPSFSLMPRDHQKFRKAFIEVLAEKKSVLSADKATDIGLDIANKFINWPKDKSNLEEYYKRGEYRPSELLIYKSSDSGCEVSSLTSPIIGPYPVPEKHKETFNEVFSPTGVKANKQLKLAKEKGARETILLLACDSFVEEGLIKGHVQSLDHQLVSDIACIYLVDIGNKDRVVKIYPD